MGLEWWQWLIVIAVWQVLPWIARYVLPTVERQLARRHRERMAALGHVDLAIPPSSSSEPPSEPSDGSLPTGDSG